MDGRIGGPAGIDQAEHTLQNGGQQAKSDQQRHRRDRDGSHIPPQWLPEIEGLHIRRQNQQVAPPRNVERQQRPRPGDIREKVDQQARIPDPSAKLLHFDLWIDVRKDQQVQRAGGCQHQERQGSGPRQANPVEPDQMVGADKCRGNGKQSRGRGIVRLDLALAASEVKHRVPAVPVVPPQAGGIPAPCMSRPRSVEISAWAFR